MAEFSSAFSSAFDAVLNVPSLTDPCDWPVSYAGCVGGVMPEPLATMAASGVSAFEDMATQYLWNWTGQAYGLCEVTVRPCRSDCQFGVSTFWGASGRGSGVVGSLSGAPWTPVIIGGQWFNLGCGRCGDSCSCDNVSSLRLPGPIASVQEVIIDGVVLASTAYRVDDRTYLVRTDGGQWPTCQSMGLATTEENTWAITYTRGVAVPAGGQIAAGRLATELAKAACGDKTCELPARVQTVTRQGVTTVMLDSFDDIDKGHTGIWIIDSWVSSVMRRPRRMAIYSPDRRSMDRVRRTTWTG